MKTLKILATLGLMAVTFACTSAADKSSTDKAIDELNMGLSKTSVFDTPTPNVYTYSDAKPGYNDRIAKAWDELPEDLQTMIRVTAMANDLWSYSQFETLNLTALHELKENHGVEAKPFPGEVLAELKRLTREALDEEAAKDPQFKKVYEAYQAFQANHEAWNSVADKAYQDALE